MATKRVRVSRMPEAQITEKVIEAFLAGDYLALHRALRLRPWQWSPLPVEISALGVDYGPAPDYANAAEWRRAQELRRAIEARI